jgi:hypothetical protein
MIDQSWPSDRNERVLEKKNNNNNWKLCTRLVLSGGFGLGILVVLPNMETK